MNKLPCVTLGLSLCLLGGCAAPLVTYKSAENQIVAHSEDRGTITNDEREYSLIMYPTLRYQSPTDLPTLTLSAQRGSQNPIDLDPASARAYLRNLKRRAYTLEQRVSEIYH